MEVIEMIRWLYQIKDNYADTKAKYKELLSFESWTSVPKKYIDSKISHRHSYYFTNETEAETFLNELSNKYENTIY